jgi:hypothetical protein
MKATDVMQPCKTAEIGTPNDYTNERYLIYFEVGEYQNRARAIIESYLDDDRRSRMQTLPYGYLVEIPIQIAPEIVRALVQESIAVYQVKRCAKIV